jgi:hypothetical protein
MPNQIANTPEEWRNLSTKAPKAAFRLEASDLKRLYKIINDKQIEHRDQILALQEHQPNESEEEFNARKIRVRNSFVTAMTITQPNGEYAHGNNSSFLDEDNLPGQVRSILFDTSTVPRADINYSPVNRITVFLDFSHPAPINLNALPSLATSNESNIEIWAKDASWYIAARSQLDNFFEERKTKTGWVHRAFTYDILVFLFGLPISLWLLNKLGRVIEPIQSMPAIIKYAIYIYGLFLLLNLFRVFYTYSRWVFPLTELVTKKKQAFLLHRAAWVAITLGVAASIFYDVMKFLATT